ncbi:MAG: MGDG synthase family glycosyltransferase [Desulfitobacteriaceae bacterium]
MKTLRVLVFSSTFGAGHVRAAEAIIESIQKLEPTVEITHLDFMALVSKVLNLCVRGSYIWVIKHMPKLWGKFYERTSKIPYDSLLQRFFNTLGHKEFAQYINLTKPDLIICTYPTITGILAQLKRNRVFNIPLATVITDYTVHSQWIHPSVDLYIVGCKEVYEGLISRGIDPIQIYITGIPVNAKFERNLEREGVLAKLNLLVDRPTFLIMGGAYGVLGKAKLFCKILDNAEYPIQSIVVCGENKKLYNSLDSLVRKGRNSFVRLGFVDNIDELMTVADVIITKAGGLTVSEALTKCLPMVIFKPIPGQEEKNAMYIKNTGAGKVVNNKKELVKALYGLIKYPEEIEEMRRAATGVVHKNSADRAANVILSLCSYHFNKVEERLDFDTMYYA